MTQSGYTVERYSEVPKTITLTLNRIFQLRFCRSLILDVRSRAKCTCFAASRVGPFLASRYCSVQLGDFGETAGGARENFEKEEGWVDLQTAQPFRVFAAGPPFSSCSSLVELNS